MPRLVHYRQVNAIARRAARYHPYGRYMSMAYRAASNPTVRRTVRRVYRKASPYAKRFFKRKQRLNYLKRQKRRIGSEPNTSNGLRHLTLSYTQAPRNTKTLYVQELIDMPKFNGVGALQRYQRIRDTVQVNGLKICLHTVNRTRVPLFFHWAIVQRKNSDNTDATNLADDFFRNPLNGQRAIDAGTALTGMEWHCNAINTDLMIIKCHYKYVIQPDNDTQTVYNPTMPNYIDEDRYLHINKQFRFSSVDLKCETPLLLVMWYSQPDEISGSNPRADVLFTSQKGHVYFRNPRV